jgi:uncharacterized glyoxalase superfamily protein PhnB
MPARSKARRTAARKTRRRAARKTRRLVQRKRPETLRLRTASPGFTANDLGRSLAWYRDVLGFTVKDRGEENGKLMWVELVAGGVTFYVSQDDWKKGRDRKKGEGFSLYCTTGQNVDDLAAAIKARGGALAQEPRDTPWGTRDFAVTDPDGFRITIGSA